MSDRVKELYEHYSKILDDTRDWRVNRDKMRKFYFGQQYSSSLSEKYAERGWVDIVINRVRPLLRTRVSMLIAGKPEGKVYGVQKGDIATAIALEEFLDWHWYKSDGQIVAEDINMAAQREGVGYFVLWFNNKLDWGRGELQVDSETFEHVFVDKAARKWDFGDAPRIIHSKLVRPEDFRIRFPNVGITDENVHQYLHTYDIPEWAGREQSEDEQTIGTPMTMEDPRYIREFDVYEKFYKDVRILHYLPTGTVTVIEDDYVLTEGDKELIAQGIIREAEAPVPRIKWTKFISSGEARGKILHEETLPITNYPIIPVQDERTGNAMPLGEIDFQRGSQELLNKCGSMILLNAALGSSFKMLVDSGAAGIDIEKFRSQWAIPGYVHDMKKDPLTGTFPIEIVRPEAINPAFWNWMQAMMHELEFQISTFSVRTGDASQAPETYGATLQIGEWAQDILRMPLNHWELALQRQSELLLEWSPNIYDQYKSFEVLREDQPDEQFINAPFPMSAFTPGGRVQSQNNINTIKARFRIRSGSTMPSMATAHMMLYGELAKNDPYWRQYLVDYLPVKEKDQIKKELSLVNQVGNENEQLKQAVTVMQAEMQRMYQEIQANDKQIELEKFRTKINAELERFKADLEVIKAQKKYKARNVSKVPKKPRNA